jgi:RNA-directed DNA polymerase
VKSRTYRKWYVQRWPSGRTMASIRGKVKAITAPRSRLRQPIGQLVSELNPVLRGWCNYFRWGNSAGKFTQIDRYVQERLALLDNKKRQRAGRRWGEEHSAAWYGGLGVQRLPGPIRYAPPSTATISTSSESRIRETLMSGSMRGGGGGSG